jgi:hypothetical protein
MGKEPWNYSAQSMRIAVEWLSFRHKLIPYIYSMNYKTHYENLPLCMPVYYHHPYAEDAYKIKNQYFFGSELLVLPLTTKIKRNSLCSSEKMFIPKGRWTDVFTGQIYNGEKTVTVNRDISSFPVLAKEGAIIPLADQCGAKSSDSFAWENIPSSLVVWIFRGNNSFVLYEDRGDDNGYLDGIQAFTEFAIKEESDNLTFTVKTDDKHKIIPKERRLTLIFKDVVGVNKITLFSGDETTELFPSENAEQNVKIICIQKDGAPLSITLTGISAAKSLPFKEALANIFIRYQAQNIKKTTQYNRLKNLSADDVSKKIKKMLLPAPIKAMIKEIIDIDS